VKLLLGLSYLISIAGVIWGAVLNYLRFKNGSAEESPRARRTRLTLNTIIASLVIIILLGIVIAIAGPIAHQVFDN
jgi:ABC-type uncharacterized transport system permease subunit